MCSTFKTLAVAAALNRVDQGEIDIYRRVSYGSKELLGHSPVTAAHLSEGSMSLAGLCEAALTEGDNTAANLVLSQVGGPRGVTRWLRKVGDLTTRLDRTEPDANTCVPGDPRDTTTPRAMAEMLRKLLLGNTLSPASRGLLYLWMTNCKIGAARIRAGAGIWSVADRTGAGANGTANDVAILRGSQDQTILLAVYLTRSKLRAHEQDSLIAELTRTVLGELRDPCCG